MPVTRHTSGLVEVGTELLTHVRDIQGGIDDLVKNSDAAIWDFASGGFVRGERRLVYPVRKGVGELVVSYAIGPRPELSGQEHYTISADGVEMQWPADADIAPEDVLFDPEPYPERLRKSAYIAAGMLQKLQMATPYDPTTHELRDTIKSHYGTTWVSATRLKRRADAK